MKEKILTPKVIAPVIIMAVLITASGIYFHQNFLRMAPLYVSLFVMILAAGVSRYAYLLGGLNSILYAAIYLYYGLYGIAAEALLFSFPIQIFTFFNWKKKSEKGSVRLRKMSALQRVICLAAFALSWTALYFILKKAGSGYALLDNTSTILGVFISILTALAYIEYSYLMLPSGIINIVLYIQMISNQPEQVPYLIYSVYSMICVSIQFVNAQKLWRKQNEKTDK